MTRTLCILCLIAVLTQACAPPADQGVERGRSQIVLLTVVGLIALFTLLPAAVSFCKAELENNGMDPNGITTPTAPPAEQLADLVVALLAHSNPDDLLDRAKAFASERPFADRPLETRHPNAVALVAICGESPCGAASGVALGPDSRSVLTAGHVVDEMAAQGATAVCILFNQYTNATKTLQHCEALDQGRLLIFDPSWRDNTDAIDLGGITFSKTPAELGTTEVTTVLLADTAVAGRTLMFVEPNAFPGEPQKYTDNSLPATQRLMVPIDGASARFVSSVILTAPNEVTRDNFMQRSSEYFAPIQQGSSGSPLLSYVAGPTDGSTQARSLVLHGILDGPYVSPVAFLQQSQGQIVNDKDQIAMGALQELEASGVPVDPNAVFLQMVFTRVDRAVQTTPSPQEFIEFLQTR
jgi:hypothetical protein